MNRRPMRGQNEGSAGGNATAQTPSGDCPLTATILGLKREIKTVRAKVRELAAQNERWRGVAGTLRAIAGLDEEKFRNLLRAESLPVTE